LRTRRFRGTSRGGALEDDGAVDHDVEPLGDVERDRELLPTSRIETPRFLISPKSRATSSTIFGRGLRSARRS